MCRPGWGPPLFDSLVWAARVRSEALLPEGQPLSASCLANQEPGPLPRPCAYAVRLPHRRGPDTVRGSWGAPPLLWTRVGASSESHERSSRAGCTATLMPALIRPKRTGTRRSSCLANTVERALTSRDRCACVKERERAGHQTREARSRQGLSFRQKYFASFSRGPNSRANSGGHPVAQPTT